MSDLKNSWKEAGTGIGHAFKGLGKTLVKTGATALGKADAAINKEAEEPTKESAAETAPVEEVKEVFCSGCGTKILSTDKFCKGCGAKQG